MSGKASIDDVNEVLEAELPDEEWDTVAGLVLDLFGRIPERARRSPSRGSASVPRRCIGRRIAKVLITREPSEDGDPIPAEVGGTEG